MQHCVFCNSSYDEEVDEGTVLCHIGEKFICTSCLSDLNRCLQREKDN